MTATPAIHQPDTKPMHTDNPKIRDILDRGKIVTDLHISSKKKLLEYVAEIFADHLPQLDAGQVFTTLIDRENLGSTGIGHGVALPHGRIPGLDKVAGIFLRLDQPLDYDAADQLPVTMVFAILVPEDATEEHLNLLAGLAAVFRDDEKRQQLMQLSDASLIKEIFDNADNHQPTP